ncbi:MAG: hypothetical protein GY876_05125 [Planctomycetes bacterium]|nr:hypothetical protein [Planctomycetota bacterium]
MGMIRISVDPVCLAAENGGASVDNEPARWPGSPHMDPVAVVVLEHSQEGREVHWDLLIARGQQPTSLWGVRCCIRPDTAPVGAEILLERTEDHDAAWLDREGAVSGGRGQASRLAAGFLRGCGKPVAEVTWSDGRASCWQLRSDHRTLYIIVTK